MSRKESKFFDYLSNYKLLKKVTARRNYFYMIIRVFSLYCKDKDDDYNDSDDVAADDNNNNDKCFKYNYLYVTMRFVF